MQFVTSRSFEILLRARVDGRKKLAALSRKRKAKNTGEKKKKRKKKEKREGKKKDGKKEKQGKRDGYNGTRIIIIKSIVHRQVGQARIIKVIVRSAIISSTRQRCTFSYGLTDASALIISPSHSSSRILYNSYGLCRFRCVRR